jgi:hypothetical protein
MTFESAIEWCKPHPSTILDDWFCCTIQINITIFAIPCTELLTCNRQGTIGTVSQKDTFTTGCNENFGERGIVDLDLVAVIE